MYNNTVTVFNRYKTADGDIWFPSVLRDVDLNADKAAIIAKYGAQSTDAATLHVKYDADGDSVYIGGKKYLTPKEWNAQEREALADCITFSTGNAFDFFIVGEWQEDETISDNDYLDGFYNFANSRYDYVYAFSSVAMYSGIPHFEIMAK